MIIDVRDIKRHTGSKKSYSFNEGIDVSENEESKELAVSVGVELTNTGKSILIKGFLKAKPELQCSRCLGTFAYDMESPFQEEFFSSDADAPVSNKIMDPSELDVFFYQGNLIDLKEVCRQIYFVSIPLTVICSGDCKGLCSNCGVDLNKESCLC